MFTTKQKLSKDKFYQGSNDQLILTGQTYISKLSGDTTTFKNVGIDITNYDFRIGSGFTGTVWDIQYFVDGSLLIGGDFEAYDGVVVGGLAKLNSDGSLDEDFNNNIGAGASGYVQRIAIQSDNKIVLVGEFTTFNSQSVNRIVRLNSNGTIDDSFEVGSGFDGAIYNGLAIQDDGKIVVSGDFTAYSGITVGRIVRLNSNGGLDDSFVTGSGFDAFVSDILIQDDGKIVVAGLYSTYSGVTANSLIRLNSNGGIDETFNVGTGFAVGSEYALKMGLQSDGKIVLAGLFTGFNGVSANSVIRLNSDGSVDNTFEIGSGIEGGTSTVNSVKIRDDGKILLGGDFDTYNSIPFSDIVLLNSDGTIDELFNIKGGINSYVWVVQSSGSSVYAGGDFTSYNGNDINRFIKISTEGELLTGEANIIAKNSFIAYDGTYDATRLRDSYLTPKSYVDNYIQGENGITKSSDGVIKIGGELTESTTIASDGIFTQKSSQFNLWNSYSKGIQLNSKFYSSGEVLAILSYGAAIYVGNDITLLKYDTQYNLERSVNISNIKTLARTTDGLYVGGGFSTTFNASTQNRILRLNDSSLAFDNTFIVGDGFNGDVNIIEVDELVVGSKVLVGGDFTSYDGVTSNRIVRLNNDGSIDDTFDVGVGFNGTVNTIKIQSDDKILVGGNFTSYSGVTGFNRIIRLNTDGSVDNTFDAGAGFNSTVFVIEIQPDDKILVGGSFSSYSGVTGYNKLIRLNTDGSVDNTFDMDAGFSSSVIHTVHDVLVDSTKIIAVGRFTILSGTTTNRIVRLNSNGTRDNTFNIGTGFNAAFGFSGGPKVIEKVDSSPVQYLVGGAFTTYQGNSCINLALLSDTGLEADFPLENITLNDKMNYNSDYSSGFTKHSIADVNYVTGLTSNLLNLADNGVKRALDTVVLGGELTGQTAISGDVVTLTLDKVNDGFHLNFRDYSETSKTISTSYEKLNQFNYISVNASINRMARIPSTGDLLISGAFTDVNDINSSGIALLSGDGVINENFSSNIGSGPSNNISGIFVDDDENIYVYGVFNSFNSFQCTCLVKLLHDGTVDTGFTFYLSGESIHNVGKVLGLSDGKLYIRITESVSGVTYIRRVNTDGTLDNTFDTGAGFNDTPYDFAVLNDDTLIVVGAFTEYSGNTLSTPYIVALNTDGTISETFIPEIFDGQVSSIIKLDSTDRFLLSGSFSTYGSSSVNTGLMVVDATGVFDEEFNTNVAQVPSIGTYSNVFVNEDYHIFMSSKSQMVRVDLNGNYIDQHTGSDNNPNNMVFVFDTLMYINSGVQENPIFKRNYSDFEEYFVVHPELLSTQKFRYVTDLSSGFTKHSLVDVNYVTGITSGIAVNVVGLEIVTGSSFTASTSSHFIHYFGDTAGVIYLPPSPTFKQQIYICDAIGGALDNNITVDGNGYLINGSSTAIINANYTSIMLVYNGINWMGGTILG